MRAVLLRIHSPGGTVTASDMIYREIVRFKEDRDVPVVAQCMGVVRFGRLLRRDGGGPSDRAADRGSRARSASSSSG